MKFTLTIPEKTIADSYRQVLAAAAKTASIKGYRPGKAPLNLVEANVDSAKLYQQVLQQVFPPAYAAYLKAHNLKPIAPPKVELTQAQPKGNWELQVEIAEMPDIKLGDYRSAVKSSLSNPKIWTPNQGDPKSSPKPPTDSDKLNAVIEALLKTVKVEIPPLLIDDEVEHRLSHLIHQLNQLGIDLTNYSASVKKTPDEIKADYRREAETSLKVEFILDAIAKDANLSVSDQEIDDFIAKIDDSKVKDQVKKDSDQRQKLAAALTKQAVTAYLMKLAE